MNRKWAALAVTMLSAALAVTGLALADDEDSPLHKIMEKVQVKNGVITKGTRNAVNYAKNQKDVAAAADDLVKLSKEAKSQLNASGRKTAKAKGVANADEEWGKLMDDFTKESETFAKLVSDKSTKQDAAKNGYKVVSKTCTACHDKFRSDEE